MSVAQSEQKQCSMKNLEPKCSCGAERKPWRTYCVVCANRHRKRHCEKTPGAKMKANARSYLHVYVRRGKVAKTPCACGSLLVEAHHEDYSRPLDVVWLCRKCHGKKHGFTVRAPNRHRSSDSGKPPSLYEFYRLLHARQVTASTLAEQLGVNRVLVTRVLNGSLPADPLLPKLAALLNPAENALLELAHKTVGEGSASPAGKNVPGEYRRRASDFGKPPELYEFYRLLRERLMDTGKLAAVLNVSRPAVTRVLNGARRRGPLWPKVVALLKPLEIAALEAAHQTRWAKDRISKRPKWNPKAAWRKQALTQ